MPKRQKKMMTIDGNTAATHVAYAFSDLAALYPITPSTPMGEIADVWSAEGRKNLFGQQLYIAKMQSEAGAAGAVHGALATGALATTFTASQGLLLMLPNMYKIAGELLPTVIHVSARAIASHALSIFGDHSDVMSARQTGFAMLASGSVQEAVDLSLVAHLATLKTKIPFLHFFDGFRTSHEIAKVDVPDYEEISALVPWEEVSRFRRRAMNPEHPHLRGTAQNPDVFFQAREASNRYYMEAPRVVAKTMVEVEALTGRPYGLFDYVGAADATRVVITMGSASEVADEAVSYFAGQGEKVGALKVRLYRPWSAAHFLDALPNTVERIAVLDRTKEAGSQGEPLYQDVCTTLKERESRVQVVGGRYGLGSKDFTPAMFKGVLENLARRTAQNHFTVGIRDDVTDLSLPEPDEYDTSPPGTINCKFWGLGADGTVGANTNAVKIVGDNTDLFAQAYFAYDAKKSGGTTVSHLRFGPEPIRASYLIRSAHYIACHSPSFVESYDILDGIKEGGTFVLNCPWGVGELGERFPRSLRRTIAERKVKLFIIDAVKLAGELGLGGRINMIMQTVFFSLAKVLPEKEAIARLKDAIEKTYSKKGRKIVEMNWAGVDGALARLQEVEVPAGWGETGVRERRKPTRFDWVSDVMKPMAMQRGNALPVSAFASLLDGNYTWTAPDGSFPVATSKHEKRAVAIEVPAWIPDNCIQCNQCALVCPHAAVRPFLHTEDELEGAPEGFVAVPALGKKLKPHLYSLQVSQNDCVGCGSCADVCPGRSKNKALVMRPHREEKCKQPFFDYAVARSPKPDLVDSSTVKGSQFLQPLFEFSGACPGCGETPYVKLASQLFGDRMLIANATGCSSIYGGSPPAVPFCVNEHGHGPAWANSLFEDNAEFGYGMVLAHLTQRDRLARLMTEALGLDIGGALKEGMKAWLEEREHAEASRAAGDRVAALLERCTRENTLLDEIRTMRDLFTKKSVWAMGGDGWAYDIGFGGIDHVAALNKDINILVMDTESCSNTGGQSSKGTPTGSVTKFAASGKKTGKKDLGRMIMNYGHVYVASVAMGANQKQCLKAFQEAEAYPGPSLIIAYSPCINQGLKYGMNKSQEESRLAVEAGYWILYRYNPALKSQGKNPLILDSKEPTGDFGAFLSREVRYASLRTSYPEEAKRLHERLELECRERYLEYRELARESDKKEQSAYDSASPYHLTVTPSDVAP
ncbi:MAG: pyruvate:ferredoxin (flavodoxin) oxidoreductase [Proteobacteria bacterium]|nr:pyruvate:ferredoxin (flavodoxin) oxidoreductase [Pseudomonadota bacterium]